MMVWRKVAEQTTRKYHGVEVVEKFEPHVLRQIVGVESKERCKFKVVIYKEGV